jgi:hypothetical protein
VVTTRALYLSLTIRLVLLSEKMDLTHARPGTFQ